VGKTPHPIQCDRKRFVCGADFIDRPLHGRKVLGPNAPEEDDGQMDIAGLHPADIQRAFAECGRNLFDDGSHFFRLFKGQK
jgi:hypothetical protein